MGQDGASVESNVLNTHLKGCVFCDACGISQVFLCNRKLCSYYIKSYATGKLILAGVILLDGKEEGTFRMKETARMSAGIFSKKRFFSELWGRCGTDRVNDL